MFGVRLVSAHGEPVVSASVVVTGTVAGTPGGVLFGCGAIMCTFTTDGAGLAQTTVILKQSGSVTLTAAEQGVPSVTSQFFAVSGTQSVSAMRAKQYVAADESVTWDAKVTVLQNGIPSIGQAVIWSAPELGVAQASTSTDTTGVAAGNLRGTLAAGVQVTVTGCAWGSVCASLQAQGVSATEWKVNIVSGAVQSVNFSDTLSPLILRITDAADNPVAGVPVSVLQTAEGWQPVCSGNGRCEVPPIYGKSSTTVVSDGDGLVVVIPLAFADTAEVTKIAAVAGSNGHISLSLEKRP
jgi:hypothetical protein